MAQESYFDRTPEQNYSLFLIALAGIEVDAGIEGYSQEGIRLLREALEEFRSEYRIRHQNLRARERTRRKRPFVGIPMADCLARKPTFTGAITIA